MRVAIYVRVSRNDPLGTNSIPHQLSACRRRVAEEGWDIVGEFVDEGISAYDRRKTRPAYQRMLALIESGGADAPLAAEVDRLLRSWRDGRWWLDRQESGKRVRLLFVDSPDLSLSRAGDWKSFADGVTAAEHFSRRLSERVRRTFDARADADLWTGPPGFGLRRVRTASGVRLEVVPKEAAVLRKMAQDVINGVSLTAIAQKLGPEWTRRRVRETLLNPRNVGRLVQRGEVRGDVKASWKPILDERVWRQVCGLLNNPARTVTPRGFNYPMSGLLFCGECGRRLRGRPLGDQRTYVCTGPEDRSVHQRLNADRVDEAIIRAADDASAPGPVSIRAIPDDLLERRNELERKRASWMVEAARAGLGAADIKAGADAVDADLAAVDEQVASATAPPADWQSLYGPDEPGAFVRTRLERVIVKPAPHRGFRGDVRERLYFVWREGVTHEGTPPPTEDEMRAARKPRTASPTKSGRTKRKA